MRLPVLLPLLLAAPVRAQHAPSLQSKLGGAVIRSDKWKMDRLRGVEEFIGNVFYHREGESFRSDWAHWDRTRERFRARGRIRARQESADGETLRVWTQRLAYDAKAEVGATEKGSPIRFERTGPAGEILEGEAAGADWDGSRRAATLRGAVELRGSSETARSEKAVYSASDRTFRLEQGPPVVTLKRDGMRGALQAERLDLLPDEGRLKARGSVRGWVKFE